MDEQDPEVQAILENIKRTKALLEDQGVDFDDDEDDEDDDDEEDFDDEDDDDEEEDFDDEDEDDDEFDDEEDDDDEYGFGYRDGYAAGLRDGRKRLDPPPTDFVI